MKGNATRMLPRRRFLARSAALALGSRLPAWSRVLLVTPAALGAGARDAHAAGGFGDWSQHARAADASFGAGPDDSELQAIISSLASQNVSVVETDTVLSNWMSDADFSAAMADAARFNQMVHAAGLKVVWYYPSLEVISVGGANGPSMYKTHSDWVQVGLNGQPNVFTGSLVFWVDPNDESAWMSPNGPWRQAYLDRIKLLAQTGTDGIWPDVPIYFNGVVDWSDASSWGKAAFKADTGLDLPATADWNDPYFRRWVEWRHRNLSKFQLDIAAAARSVNPAIQLFVETVTCDYHDATLIGLDGAYLRAASGITQVWEIDVLSNSDAMRYAQENDWICLISMCKYARAASAGKPAWSFSYGKQEDDAVQVMAEVLAAGCSPFEVQVPGKTVGVGAAMRTRMYAFVQANSARLFDAAPLANVALYHSSASRDYVNPSIGNGLYCTTAQPDSASDWWSTTDTDSCYQQQWLGEFRGMVKALVHAHVPFSVVTSPAFSAADLAGIKALLLPDLEAVSDNEAALVRQFVNGGGTIVVTGPNPTGLNEFGDARADFALADVLGFHKGGALPASRQAAFGAGRMVYFSDLPGKQYLLNGMQADSGRIVGALAGSAVPVVATDADRRIHVEANQLGNEMLLHFTNFMFTASGVFQVQTTNFNVSATPPAGKRVTAVSVSSPDNADASLQPVPFSANGNTVTFALSVRQYSLVVLSLQ
ncbi:hypothetical protein ACEPT7_05610 [Burkholderia ubonensis]|uniref:hypothetical protein n=1 Tax=Burkholderia ubonensis TaxID=101571 RepID=UPI00358E089A